MNDEKKIAQAILDAQKMHKESYDVETSQYKWEIESCLIIACKNNSLSPNLWCLLSLAMHWWNDAQLWAEDVLAGKNIYDELHCEVENGEEEELFKNGGFF